MNIIEIVTLERHLGDPFCGESHISHQKAMKYDESEEIPEILISSLTKLGFHKKLVPNTLGGELKSYEELGCLWQIIARRDVTVAILQVISYIAAAPVWLAGSKEQQDAVAKLILSGQSMSFALTERNCGADLLATSTIAFVTGAKSSTLILNGEKWLIGNGHRSSAVTVFTRTNENRGPGAFSFLLVFKNQLEVGTLDTLPREKTVGLRAMDLSGLAFKNAVLDIDAIVGKEGHGLETMLKAQQMARVMICCITIGALDTALRSIWKYSSERFLYGASIQKLPQVAKVLAEITADTLICDLLVKISNRGFHIIPEQMSLLSAIAKVFIPEKVNESMSKLATVLGARSFLRSEENVGIFQKMARDVQALSIAEGSTSVNLKAIAMQLPALSSSSVDELSDDNFALLFRSERPLTQVDLSRLSVTNFGQDSIVGRVKKSSERDRWFDDTLKSSDQVSALVKAINEFHEKIQKIPLKLLNSIDSSPELFDLAREYTRLHVASACVLYNDNLKSSKHAFLNGGGFLKLALYRLGLKSLDSFELKESRDQALDFLGKCTDTDYLISTQSISLAPCNSVGYRA